MTEIEDVPRMTGIVEEDSLGAGQCHGGPAEHEGWVEVALNDGVSAKSLTSLGDRRTPIETDDRRVGLIHQLQQMVATDTEMDARRSRMTRRQLVENLARMGQHEPLIVRP